MTTSKTIAALLGPTLIATAVSLLANLDISQTLIEGLSQSPALIMIAGYAAFVPGSCHRLFPQQMDERLAGAGDRDGMALAVRRPPAHGVSHTACRNGDKNCSGRRGRLSCLRGRIPADRRVSLVQGIWSRVTRRRGYRSVASKTSASVARSPTFAGVQKSRISQHAENTEFVCRSLRTIQSRVG